LPTEMYRLPVTCIRLTFYREDDCTVYLLVPFVNLRFLMLLDMHALLYDLI